MLVDYDSFATHFDKTRYNHWKSVKEFILSLPPNATVLDLGCGNGKYMSLRSDLKFTGLDTSQKLLEICASRYPNHTFLNVSLSDPLPFATQSFDYTICIAVLHHLENPVQAYQEAIRVTKNKLLCTVWADGAQKPTWTPLGNNNYHVPWNNQVQRFYHLYTEKEVKEMFPNASVHWECQNWVIQVNTQSNIPRRLTSYPNSSGVFP